MKHSVPHNLDMDLIKKVTDKALKSYRDRFADYNPEVSWTEDTCAEVKFSAKGVTMTGSFEVHEDRVDMDMDVPFIFKLFQKKAIEVIEREIQKWIAKAESGELQ